MAVTLQTLLSPELLTREGRPPQVTSHLTEGMHMTDFPRDRRLTCNRIFRHLLFYSQQGFSGRLDVSHGKTAGWSVYMHEGRLTWATGGRHPRRRWQRQLHLTTGRKVDSARIGNHHDPCWDYWELQRLAALELPPAQVAAIVRGILMEVCFDIVQAFELPLAPSILKHHQPLLPLSQLAGVGDGLQVMPVSQGISAARCLPTACTPSAPLMQQETQAAWQRWVELGLLDASPDSAPLIGDPQRLSERIPEKAFRNLSALLDGRRTLRDIAVRLKHGKSQLGVGKALAPHVRQGLITFRPVGDIGASLPGGPDNRQSPFLLSVGSAWGDLGAIESLVARLGYACRVAADGVGALQELRCPSAPKPLAILVSDDPPLFSAIEVCKILRRVERLRDVPIVVYAPGHRDPKQMRDALQTGANEYFFGPELGEGRLRVLLERYKRQNSTIVRSNRETQQAEVTRPHKQSEAPVEKPVKNAERASSAPENTKARKASSRLVVLDGTCSSRNTLLVD